MAVIADLVKKVMTRQMAKTIETTVTGAVHRPDEDGRWPYLVRRKALKEQSRWLVEELDAPMPTRFSSVYEFVDEVVLDLYGFDPANDRRWCRRWWAHPAAVRRLTMMWASWEHYRAEAPATGEETWTRLVADHHMTWLAGPFGPFTGCQFAHVDSPPLDSEPMPLDWLDKDADAGELDFPGQTTVPDGSSGWGEAGDVDTPDSWSGQVDAEQADPGPAGEHAAPVSGGVEERSQAGSSGERGGGQRWRLPGFGS
ncbi:DUF4913 domain-containing protein [Corynebacterium bovis]|uniref:DUF4913 domain-containing protein n=1 Tax=Corynebacterium bovis TaxID=36808 RepID=UPI000F62EA6A|nr:DUF4913 domain-containing protein [Corynebacterium bovis]RRO98198.1 hypothetical protein CXF32_01750 [Corynebacterium bovis]RRQ00659.1 hypothetical protein CXF31_00015 [Corynebacterium bovis]RRQ06478.1 hypothetical protein CXF43_08605 [Corynebacterium bovis]RRQ09517.1 hypothetical protein CXF44_07735 [Corynebacterium bovis]